MIFILAALLMLSPSGLFAENDAVISFDTLPAWLYSESEPSIISKDFKSVMIIGDFVAADDAELDLWASRIKRISRSEKVTAAVLNHGSFNEAHLDFVASFESVDTLVVGNSIEGVVISKNAFWKIVNLKNLKVLSVAIHGLDDSYFSILKYLKSLEELKIEFPDPAMILASDRQKVPPIVLTDKFFEFLEKAEKLKVFDFDRYDDGRVEFSPEVTKFLKEKFKRVRPTSVGSTRNGS